RFTTHVKFGLEVVQQMFPTWWKRIYLNMIVCNDSNGDGSCMDEIGPHVLSVMGAGFQLKRIPTKVDLYVWAGRNHLLRSDPEVCEQQYSPIVMDLAGDGIRLTGPEHGMWFDLN